MEEDEEAEPFLEFMAKDGAWYAGTATLIGPSLSDMRVHFLHYSEDEDETWHPHSFKSPYHVDAMIRPVSEPMQDSDCAKLRRGMILCAACRRPDSDCFEYYDARLEQLNRYKHRGQGCCKCQFEVEWLGGPLKRQQQFVTCGDICLLKPGDIEDDPVVRQFIKNVKDSVRNSSKRLCVTKSISAKDSNLSLGYNYEESLPELIDSAKQSSISEPNQNVTCKACVGEEERCPKVASSVHESLTLEDWAEQKKSVNGNIQKRKAEDPINDLSMAEETIDKPVEMSSSQFDSTMKHNEIINLDSDDENDEEEKKLPTCKMMEPQEGKTKEVSLEKVIPKTNSHYQGLTYMELDTAGKTKSYPLESNNMKHEVSVKEGKSDFVTQASNAPKTENFDGNPPLEDQSVPLERSPGSVDNTVYHITDDILPDRLSQANACVQHPPSMFCTSLPSNSHECGTMDSILIAPLQLQANMCGHGSSLSCNDHCLDGCQPSNKGSRKIKHYSYPESSQSDSKISATEENSKMSATEENGDECVRKLNAGVLKQHQAIYQCSDGDEDDISKRDVLQSSKENFKALDKSQILLVENLEMNLTPSMALKILLEVSSGALMVYIWPHLEYEITKKAYILYEDSQAANIAYSTFHSDKFMVISSKKRPWVVSRSEHCLLDWNQLYGAGGTAVAIKEQEACTKENQSSDDGDLSILHRGTEGYASVVARYKLFLVQKEKLRTYNRMFQEEEKMLEEALSS